MIAIASKTPMIKPDLGFLGGYIKTMRQMHEGQVDKLGKPYWLHPLRVAKSMIFAIEQDQVNRDKFDSPEDLPLDGITCVFGEGVFADNPVSAVTDVAKWLLLTALFHDVIEDCANGQKQLEDALAQENDEIRENVMRSVKILTKPKSQPYLEYIFDVIDSDDAAAFYVKRADMQSNLERVDLIEDEATRGRLRHKYRSGLAVLKYGVDKD